MKYLKNTYESLVHRTANSLRHRHSNSYKVSVERESELWGKVKNRTRLSWFDSPMISRYINRSVSGDSHRDWLDYVKEVYFPKPAALGLNVGCGHGELERLILQRGLARRMDGFDISPKAVELAQEQTTHKGLDHRLRYFIADANFLEKVKFENQYDLILASMSLHHFARLEKCLDSLSTQLKPGGYFIANEFVGPNRFQWTDTQLDIVNRLLACLPSKLRHNLRSPEHPKHTVTRPSLDYMHSHSPFEAVCSERIIPALRERFEIVEQNNYGGTILHLLFESIMGNFNEETNREHAVIIRFAIECETLLLDAEVLPHDHALLICRKS